MLKLKKLPSTFVYSFTSLTTLASVFHLSDRFLNAAMLVLNSLVVAFLAGAACAQSPAQISAAAALSAQVPACARPCDDAAILQVGCSLTDYSCHCAHASQLSTIIPPCLQLPNATCTTSDLQSTLLFLRIPTPASRSKVKMLTLFLPSFRSSPRKDLRCLELDYVR
jgi:hypothetical protein